MRTKSKPRRGLSNTHPRVFIINITNQNHRHAFHEIYIRQNDSSKLHPRVSNSPAMNGPGGNNPPRPGDTGCPGVHKVPNSSALQQPTARPRFPETTSQPDETPSAQRATDGHGGYSTPDRQPLGAGSPTAQHGHQQYQPTQASAAPTGQPNVQAHYSTWLPTPPDKDMFEFASTAAHMHAHSSDYISDLYNYAEGLLSPSADLNSGPDGDLFVGVQHGQMLGSDGTDRNKYEDNQVVTGVNGTSYGNLGNTEETAESSQIAPTKICTDADARSPKRRKTEHISTQLQTSVEPLSNLQMPRKHRSSEASINVKSTTKQSSKKRSRKQSDQQPFLDDDAKDDLEDNANDDAAFDLDYTEATGMTIERALNIATGFVNLTVSRADDDVQRVKAAPMMWINAIMKAFRKPYAEVPALNNFRDILPAFEPWQKSHWELTKARLKRNPELLEACATVLFHNTLQSHENRGLKRCVASFALDPTLCCSKRLLVIIAAIETSAIIRWDVVTSQRLDELVGSPHNAVKTKEANKVTNTKRDNPRHSVTAKKEAGQRGKPPRAMRAMSNADKLLSLSEVAFEVSGHLSSSSPSNGSSESDPKLSYGYGGEMSTKNAHLLASIDGSEDPSMEHHLNG